ncbi:MAG: hypothetical protein AAB071_00355 [Bacteroidota bacterium]
MEFAKDFSHKEVFSQKRRKRKDVDYWKSLPAFKIAAKIYEKEMAISNNKKETSEKNCNCYKDIPVCYCCINFSFLD